MSGSATLYSRAVDDTGNVETPGPGVTLSSNVVPTSTFTHHADYDSNSWYRHPTRFFKLVLHARVMKRLGLAASHVQLAVSIAANSTYLASYHTNGHYAGDWNDFA